MEVMRESGIKGLEKIPWGTHMCMFYSEREDFSEVLVNYIKYGLKNNELCLWIYGDISKDSIIEMLEKSISSIEDYIIKGQLVLIHHSEWYNDSFGFTGEKTTNRWLKYIQLANSSGFAGLRAIGDIGWIDKNLWSIFSDYEEKLLNFMDKYPFMVICLYNLNKCNSFQIADVIRNHKYTLIKNENEWSVLKNTELKAKELKLKNTNEMLNEVLKYNKLQSEFFSNISHELKTPITLILSALQMLKEKEIKEEDTDKTASKYIDVIKNNSYRLLKLVDNIIDLTKMDSEVFNINLKNVNMVQVVENIVLSTVEFIRNKGIKVTFDTEIEEKIMAIDVDQFERIMLNLISNAVKFTKPEGNIWINIYDKESSVVISVRDNGVGIPEDKLNVIFERFGQVDKSLSREREGSGIGLSLAKLLTEKHGGTIEVISKPDKGSEFIVKLPVKYVSEEPLSFKAYRDDKQSCIQKVNIEFSDIYNTTEN